jgi:hypothetical protein
MKQNERRPLKDVHDELRSVEAIILRDSEAFPTRLHEYA